MQVFFFKICPISLKETALSEVS